MSEIVGPGLVPPPGWEDVQLIQDSSARLFVPTAHGDLELTGCVAIRSLKDGRLLAVEPLLFGSARLCIGRPDMMMLDSPWGGYDDQWEYPTVMAAVAAMAQWQPATDAEPSSWTGHQPTGRRRPGGDPRQEEVRK